MVEFQEIECISLHRLVGYLDALSDFIRGGELKWYFEVRAFDCSNHAFDINLLIQTAYPDAKLTTASIPRVSLSSVIENLKHELTKFLSDGQASVLLTPLFAGTGTLWEYMSELVDIERAQVFEYSNSEPDGLVHGLLGDFAFIFYNEKVRRCLILTGATSD